MLQLRHNRLLGVIFLCAASAISADELGAVSAVADATTSPALHGALDVLETAEPSDPDALVDIPDATLRRTLEEVLGKDEDAAITRGDMASLTHLTIDGGVDQLAGLDHAINLVSLACANGGVSDLTPLAGLSSLAWLDLRGNAISDVAPLAGLGSLTGLVLNRNDISDLTPLSVLDGLTRLELRHNAVFDIMPLAGLRSLTWLELSFNAVFDITPLARLRSLTRLGVHYNRAISDITPLV